MQELAEASRRSTVAHEAGVEASFSTCKMQCKPLVHELMYIAHAYMYVSGLFHPLRKGFGTLKFPRPKMGPVTSIAHPTIGSP